MRRRFSRRDRAIMTTRTRAGKKGMVDRRVAETVRGMAIIATLTALNMIRRFGRRRERAAGNMAGTAHFRRPFEHPADMAFIARDPPMRAIKRIAGREMVERRRIGSQRRASARHNEHHQQARQE